MLQGNALGQVLQIVGGEQPGQRVAHLVRVAQQAAVAIGAAQDLHHIVAALHGAGFLPGQFLQHQQALRQGYAASRRGRCSDQLAAALQADAQRLTLDHPVVAQVARTPYATGGFDTLKQQAGCLSGIEAGMAIARQALQGACQRRLAQQAVQRRNLPLIKEDGRAGRVLLQCLQAPFGPLAVDPIDPHAIARQADRGGQRIVQRQLAIALGQMCQGRRQAGDGRSQRAVQRQLALYRPVTPIEVRAGRQGRALAGIDEAVCGFLAGLAQQEEATPAQARAIGFGHGQRGRDGDGGIEGVTAVGQGFQAGNGGRRMGGGDGGLLRFGCCGLGGERAGQQQAGEKRLVRHELVPCWAGA